MFRLATIIITVIFLTSCGRNPADPEETQVSLGNIVGGEKTKVETYPFIVKVGDGCGGSLIAPRWVMTAAHCVPVANIIHNATVWKSNTSWYGTVGEKDVEIEKIYYHGKYFSPLYGNDIALIYLKQDMTQVDPNARPVALASSEDIQKGLLNPGNQVTAIGWGMSCEGCFDYISYLRKVDMPIVDRSKANLVDSYNGQIRDNMLVAGLDYGGKDSCQGDSGGPLVIWDKTKAQFVQVGVTSWGEGCARPKKYGVYTNVASFRSWISAVMAKHP